MIYNLFGILDYISENNDFFVIQCNGVGFKCKSDLKTINEIRPLLDSKIKVFTKMNVRENACDLFGFKNSQSIVFFDLLTSVSGVGPKAALSILSQFSTSELSKIIESNSIETLTQANGVGEKMAKRILLELKGKIKESFDNNINISNDNKMKAISALEVLGYSKSEVINILEQFDSSLSVEELIKKVLKNIGG